jgi:type III secretory pathway lipoprotein EscJ
MRSLLIAALLILCGCRETILHDLDEEQANRVWVTLRHHRIEAEKNRSGAGWSIAVEKSAAGRALTTLEKLRLPRRPRNRERSSSFIPSRAEKDLLREQQLSERLEETLSALPGVVDARVHYLLEEKERARSSASVLLVTLPGVTVDVRQIKEIVAGGGALDGGRVSVALSSLPKVSDDD